MKSIRFIVVCSLIFIGTSNFKGIQAQNAFANDIHLTGKIDYKDDDAESIFTNFKIDFPDECSAIYSYTFNWKEPEEKVDKTYLYKFQWHWKDVISINVDKDLNIVEFDTAGRIIQTSVDKDTNEQIIDLKEYRVFIYFETSDVAQNAAEWSLGQIKACGGNVSAIN